MDAMRAMIAMSACGSVGRSRRTAGDKLCVPAIDLPSADGQPAVDGDEAGKCSGNSLMITTAPLARHPNTYVEVGTVDTTSAPSERLVPSLRSISRLSLDRISPEQAANVVRHIVRRSDVHIPVEVARFGSAI